MSFHIADCCFNGKDATFALYETPKPERHGPWEHTDQAV